jgi:putative transposase
MSWMPIESNRPLPKSIRLPEFDYAGNSVYFITLCIAERAHLFGEVRNGAMAMNEFGWIVWEEWERSAEIRREIELDEFVVMPNHFHALVTIVPDGAFELPACNALPEAERFGREPQAHGRAPLRRTPRSLGSLVAGFKAATTSKINTLRGTVGTPLWQRNYYERIVRNENARTQIASYIENNPLQWSVDRENPDRDGENAFESWLFADSTPGNSSSRSP